MDNTSSPWSNIAWATKEARMRLIETVVANLRAFLDGQPVNVVD
jgi:glycerate dehydrogenase